MLVGISALVVSFVAVVVSLYSASIDRDYARASVWPQLMVARSYAPQVGKSQLDYLVINNGTGPAIVKYVQVGYDDTYYPTWRALFDSMGLDDVGFVQSQISRMVIPADKQITVLSFTNPKTIEQLSGFDNGLDFTLCYCSIYEECWQVNRQAKQRSVDACIEPSGVLFTQ